MADSYDSDKLMSLLDTTEHYKPEEAKRAKAADDHPKEKVSTQASQGTETVECEVLDDINDDPQETPQTLQVFQVMHFAQCPPWSHCLCLSILPSSQR